MSLTNRLPIAPNAADDGILNPRCHRKNVHTCPTVTSLGTHAWTKNRSTDRHVSVT
jgi:hypothetical protein